VNLTTNRNLMWS